MPPFAGGAWSDAKIPRQTSSHVPQGRHEQLRARPLLAGAAQFLFVGRRSWTLNPRAIAGKGAPSFPSPAAAGRGTQLLLQTLAQSPLQMGQPGSLRLIPARKSLSKTPARKERLHRIPDCIEAFL